MEKQVDVRGHLQELNHQNQKVVVPNVPKKEIKHWTLSSPSSFLRPSVQLTPNDHGAVCLPFKPIPVPLTCILGNEGI